MSLILGIILKHIRIKTSVLLWIFILTIVFSKSVKAQIDFKEIDYIPVQIGTNFLDYPWAGGLNSAQFCDPDLNNDGKKDLLVFEKTENRFLTFIAEDDGQYILNRDYIQHIPEVQGWVINKDFDCDGIDEIFTYNSGSIMIYKGYYDQDTLKFQLWTDGIYYGASNSKINLYSSFVDRPAIADFDFDGDLDILTFNVSANRMLLYKNMRQEKSLNCDSIDFILKDFCWGNVYESGLSPIIEMRDTCDFKFNHGRYLQRHAGSTLEAFDIRNRGVLDVLMGDASLTLVNHLKNNGDRDYASILSQDTSFPSYNIPARTYSFPLTTFIDIDHDGKKDLIVTPFEGLSVDNYENVLLYKNIGNDTLKLSLETRSFFTGEMINAGENAVPTSIDIDGDGLLDLIIGGTYRKSDQTKNTLQYFKNIGSLEYPIFQFIDDNFLNLASSNHTALHPHAGDLDHDGKIDLLVGTGDGRILYYKNTSQHRGFETSNSTFIRFQNSDLDIGQNASPFVIDYDQDGKMELFVGEFNGNINLYKNIAPTGQIQLELVTDSVGKIHTRSSFLPFGLSSITIADFDQNGKYDAIIGGYDNYLRIVYNIQDSIFSTTHPTTIPSIKGKIGRKITPSFQHFTSKNDGTLLLGLQAGGVRWYSLAPPEYRPVSTKTDLQTFNFKIYPNPFGESFIIDLPFNHQNMKWELIDILGRKVAIGDINNRLQKISTQNIEVGTYILYIRDHQNILGHRMIIKTKK